MYAMMRPLNKNELDYLQASVEDIYDSFVSIVSEGRSLQKDEVDKIAQGRVWSGVQSLDIKLTDEYGTLEDALKYAATIAPGDSGSDLSAWQIVSYPEPVDFFDALMGNLQGTPVEEEILAGTPLRYAFHTFRHLKESDSGKVYARLPFELVIR